MDENKKTVQFKLPEKIYRVLAHMAIDEGHDDVRTFIVDSLEDIAIKSKYFSDDSD